MGRGVDRRGEVFGGGGKKGRSDVIVGAGTLEPAEWEETVVGVVSSQ